MRKSFYTPKSKRVVLTTWRQEMLQRATGALTLAGGALPGSRLGAILGVSPRGLRPIFHGQTIIVAELRGEVGHTETWYRLDILALPAPMQMPPLRIAGPVKAP